jgi:hypothetical protein
MTFPNPSSEATMALCENFFPQVLLLVPTALQLFTALFKQLACCSVDCTYSSILLDVPFDPPRLTQQEGLWVLSLFRRIRCEAASITVSDNLNTVVLPRVCYQLLFTECRSQGEKREYRHHLYRT